MSRISPDEQPASIALLRGRISDLEEKRKEALNRILDIKGSIRVFCRVRADNSSTVTAGKENVTVRSGTSKRDFRLDKVFPPDVSQEEIFSEVEPVVRSAIDGHSVCVFAYGQTGTGKTFTMEGSAQQPGIVPRTMKQLFEEASSTDVISSPLTFSMSMLEIYMGSLRDLLAPRANAKSLTIQTGAEGSVAVEGLTEVQLRDFKQASQWYNRGKKARTTSWTSVNDASSRSHCLTRIMIRRSDELVGKIWMVDLGGSERLLKTGATGQTMDEGKAINLSLSALGDVICALKRKRSHIPYRNSKLTQILKNSLGKKSKVILLVHVSSSEYDIGETLCSLLFARRARGIDSGEEPSEEIRLQKERYVADLTWKMKDAEEMLEKLRIRLRQAEEQLQEKKIPEDSTRNSEISEKRGEFKGQDISLPRFMKSTACSRQRQIKANISKARSSRTRNLSGVDLSFSQSRSLMDNYSRSNFKTRLAKVEEEKSRLKSLLRISVEENVSCNSTDPQSPTLARSRLTSAALPRHRRRMSDITLLSAEPHMY